MKPRARVKRNVRPLAVPYLWSYLIAGSFLALVAFCRRKVSPWQHISGTLLIITTWPLLVLIAPEFIAKSDSRAGRNPSFTDFHDLANAHQAELSEDERRRLLRVAKAGPGGTAFFPDRENFEEILQDYWEHAIPPEVHHRVVLARSLLHQQSEESTQKDRLTTNGFSGAVFRLREPDWYIGFSAEFLNCIAGIDKNKRARLLEAIGRLSKAPVTPHGNTVKPLTGDLSGLWRYRIGDDRLLYKPFVNSKQVILISFGARGASYA